MQWTCVGSSDCSCDHCRKRTGPAPAPTHTAAAYGLDADAPLVPFRSYTLMAADAKNHPPAPSAVDGSVDLSYAQTRPTQFLTFTEDAGWAWHDKTDDAVSLDNTSSSSDYSTSGLLSVADAVERLADDARHAIRPLVRDDGGGGGQQATPDRPHMPIASPMMSPPPPDAKLGRGGDRARRAPSADDVMSVRGMSVQGARGSNIRLSAGAPAWVPPPSDRQITSPDHNSSAAASPPRYRHSTPLLVVDQFSAPTAGPLLAVQHFAPNAAPLLAAGQASLRPAPLLAPGLGSPHAAHPQFSAPAPHNPFSSSPPHATIVRHPVSPPPGNRFSSPPHATIVSPSASVADPSPPRSVQSHGGARSTMVRHSHALAARAPDDQAFRELLVCTGPRRQRS